MPYKNIEDARACARRSYYKHRRKRLDGSMAWAKKNRKRVYESWKRRLQNPVKKAAVLASYKKYAHKNRLKRNAQSNLRRAIRIGKIARGICQVCGESKTDAHHNDYSKPLEVIWLCPIHHRNLHPKKLIKS